jgi:hypothetical protein
MAKYLTILFLFLSSFINCFVNAQFSKENGGELIFAYSNVEKNNFNVPSKLRFTLFFHAGQTLHYDFTNNLGVFSGYGIRNIGIITDEADILIKRRTYSLGIPLALKLGSFKNHFYLYGGSEYEMFFHYKEKQFKDGIKLKQSEWFSNRTKRFAPSFFAGFQFPGGINLKFKYYPFDFLNRDYSDFKDYNKTQLFYFSISFNFKKNDLKKLYDPDSEPGRIAAL